MSVHAPTYRFSVPDYEKLGEAGIFHEDDRVELLNREIIIRAPIGYRHVAAVWALTAIFGDARRNRFIVSPQCPFVLDDSSEPEPDLALIRCDVRQAKRLPRTEDVFLVIEVSDHSLGYDRAEKLPAYARNGIGEVWIVNLVDDTIEAYREPDGDGYRTMLKIRRGESIAPLAFADIVVQANEVLP